MKRIIYKVKLESHNNGIDCISTNISEAERLISMKIAKLQNKIKVKILFLLIIKRRRLSF